MKQRIVIVLHQETSTAGRVGMKLIQKGYELDIRRPALGEALQDNVDDYAGAVIFGGPMSANDDCEHDYLRTEIDWIAKPLAAGVPFLGICLGGQLLARALGAQVYLHDEGNVEVGYTKIHPTDLGRPYFEHSEHFYQWHKKGFEVPDGASLLATGTRFPNQAYLYGDNKLGIQFHPEITLEMIQRWTAGAAHRMELPGAQPKEAHIKGFEMFSESIDRWGRATLDWLGLDGSRRAVMDAAD